MLLQFASAGLNISGTEYFETIRRRIIKISDSLLNEVVHCVAHKVREKGVDLNIEALYRLNDSLTAFFQSEGIEIVEDDTLPEAPKPLGLEDARDELMDDDELKLFGCEIGLFDYKNDHNTPFETHKVVVACCELQDVAEKAIQLAEESIMVVSGVVFELIGIPEEINANDY